MGRKLTEPELNLLRSLLDAENVLREELGIDKPGELTWYADDGDPVSEVIADGLGRSTASRRTSGNPLNARVLEGETFDSEDEAAARAAAWAGIELDEDFADDDDTVDADDCDDKDSADD
jgi:hypothetical protein